MEEAVYRLHPDPATSVRMFYEANKTDCFIYQEQESTIINGKLTVRFGSVGFVRVMLASTSISR